MELQRKEKNLEMDIAICLGKYVGERAEDINNQSEVQNAIRIAVKIRELTEKLVNNSIGLRDALTNKKDLTEAILNENKDYSEAAKAIHSALESVTKNIEFQKEMVANVCRRNTRICRLIRLEHLDAPDLIKNQECMLISLTYIDQFKEI